MHINVKSITNKIFSTIFIIVMVLCISFNTAVYVNAENITTRQPQEVSSVINATMTQLANTVKEPEFGTVAGEWTVLCLARGEHFKKDNAYYYDYYDRIVEYVNTKAASVDMNGALHKSKSTDNSRVILALSSIGKDATAVGDWDLITPYEDFKWIKKQGINGAVFALIALDTNNYQTTDTTIRQQCVDFILGRQLEDGGWALSGKISDPDVTAMALQSLYPYKDQLEVSAAAEAAFTCLSSMQNDDGGYASWGTVNSESCAQVIVACTAWKINPDTDARFVKNDKSVVDALLAYYSQEDSAFKHILTENIDGMATDQACYALIAYDRFLKGKNSLYDMSDVTFDNEESKETSKDEDKQAIQNPPDNTKGQAEENDELVIPITGDKESLFGHIGLLFLSVVALFFSFSNLKKEGDR